MRQNRTEIAVGLCTLSKDFHLISQYVSILKHDSFLENITEETSRNSVDHLSVDFIILLLLQH